MSNHLYFDFTVDKATNTIIITKEFNAERALVWDAFTKAEFLDQWGAPEPWKTKTKMMNFEVGGKRLYSMTKDEGPVFWSIQEYTSITPISNFQMLTNFADENGNINTQFKSSENNLDFIEENGVTKFIMTIKYASAEVLTMMVEGGFREGITMTLTMLEKLLPNFSKR